MRTSEEGLRKSRWKNAMLNTLIAIGSCALVLAAAELTVRAAGIGSDQFLRPDAVLGVRFIASKSGLSQGTCYRARVSINGHGWRGREVPLAKPAGVYRIVVLGDSFMAGLQVENERVFAHVLERRLNDLSQTRTIEVINLGVPSWGTDQEYLALREYGLQFSPDLVLLAFYGQNDIADNHPALASAKSSYPKPVFNLEHGQLVEVPFRDPTPRWIAVARQLAAPLRLYPLVRDTLLDIPLTHRALYRFGIVGVVPQPDRQHRDDQAAGSWNWPGRWKRQIGAYELDEWDLRNEAWAITERLIERARDATEKANAKFLLLDLASPLGVMPRSLREALLADIPSNELDPDRPSRLLEELAARNGIDHVSLVAPFRARIRDSEAAFEKYYLPCDGHWTAAGHDLAAEFAAGEIAERLGRGHR
jgi:hypothetical protein